jgi:GAF domain-containing protein
VNAEADRWEVAASQCAEMAHAVMMKDGVQDVLDEILVWAVRIVPGTEEAAITTARRGRRVDTVAATGPLARESNHLQHQFGQGPCHDALWEEGIFHTADLASETRWAQYAPHAAKAGIRSVLAFRLFALDNTLGALDLYSREPDAFDEVAWRIGAILAAQASVAFRWARTGEQLGEAIENRQVIGAAVGIIIERLRVTSEQAFTLLARASQETNVKVRDLAQQVVETGEVPTLRDLT